MIRPIACVLGIFYGVATAYACGVPVSGFPCTPVSFDPNNPAASGYQLVFSDDFTVSGTSTIDKNDTEAAGFKWYIKPAFNNNREPASNFTSDANGLVLQTTFNDGPGWLISTVLANTPWKGTVFSNGAYFEIRWAFDGPSVQIATGWPAWWTMSLEHDVGSRGVTAHWPGQAANYEHFMEDDFFEYDTQQNNGSWGQGLWDWSGIVAVTSCSGYSKNGVSGGSPYCGLLNNGSPQQPNNVFMCGSGAAACPYTWNVSTFHTNGHLWVAGDANNGQVGYTDNFIDGTHALAVAPSTPGATTKTTWTNTTMPAPASLPNSGKVWAIHDRHSFPVIIGTGTVNPLHVRFVKVWQIPGCGIMTTQ